MNDEPLTDDEIRAQGYEPTPRGWRPIKPVELDVPPAEDATEAGEIIDDRLNAPVDLAGDEQLIVPSPDHPMAVGRMFVAKYYTDPTGIELIRYHRGAPHIYDGTCWPEADARRVRANLYSWLEGASYWKKGKDGLPELVPFEPTRFKIGNLVEALAAIGHLDQTVTPPAWLDPEGQPPATNMVAMKNGLLDLSTRVISPHTPLFFTQHSLPFSYDPNASAPGRWMRFLKELWDDDDEAIDTLGEILGYVLSGDTRQQKLFMLIGPKRSGKGTIGRVLTGLIGPHNMVGPTLSGLTTNFGLSPLIGKPLAVMSDARLGRRVDGLVAVERLLSISGEDTLTIDRKYRDPWTGRLPTRFLILTNELPRFTDSSGALASRFVLLTLSRTFYGHEDPELTDTLLGEAPGIFNWCIEGLERLRDRGHFKLPTTAENALRQLEDLSGPVGAFVRDRCEIGPAYGLSKDALYKDWKIWCRTEGRDRPGTKAVFTRDLLAAFPTIRPVRLREGEDRLQAYGGIRLNKQWDGPLTTPDHPDRDETRVRVGSGVGDGQTRRSEAVVRGGQGSTPPSTGPESVPALSDDVRSAILDFGDAYEKAHGHRPGAVQILAHLRETRGEEHDLETVFAHLREVDWFNATQEAETV